MKKIICIILSVLFLFGLCSCSHAEIPNEPSTFDEGQSVREIRSGTEKDPAAPAAETVKTTAAQTKKTESKTAAKTTVKTEPVKTTKPAQTTQSIKKTNVCTISIDCETVLSHKSELNENLLKFIPSDGIMLRTCEVEITSEDMTVFDVLKKVCRDNGIHFEFSNTPAYNSAYIEGIGNLYERDCGALSGWMYSVNGVYPNVGCSETKVTPGDVIKWRYTCDLGWDVGGGME